MSGVYKRFTMQLEKQEFDQLIELAKTNEFLTFDVSGETLILMTQETFDVMQPSQLQRFMY